MIRSPAASTAATATTTTLAATTATLAATTATLAATTATLAASRPPRDHRRDHPVMKKLERLIGESSVRRVFGLDAGTFRAEKKSTPAAQSNSLIMLRSSAVILTCKSKVSCDLHRGCG